MKFVKRNRISAFHSFATLSSSLLIIFDQGVTILIKDRLSTRIKRFHVNSIKRQTVCANSATLVVNDIVPIFFFCNWHNHFENTTFYLFMVFRFIVANIECVYKRHTEWFAKPCLKYLRDIDLFITTITNGCTLFKREYIFEYKSVNTHMCICMQREPFIWSKLPEDVPQLFTIMQ